MNIVIIQEKLLLLVRLQKRCRSVQTRRRVQSQQKSSDTQKSSRHAEEFRHTEEFRTQKSRDTQKSSDTAEEFRHYRRVETRRRVQRQTQKSPNKHGRSQQVKNTEEGKRGGRVKVNKESVKSAERGRSISSGSHGERASTPRPMYKCPRSDTCKYVGIRSNMRRHITAYHDGFDLKTLELERITGEELEKIKTKRQVIPKKGRYAQSDKEVVQQLFEVEDRTTSWVAETINSTRSVLTDVNSVISLDSSKLEGLTCTDEELCHYLSMPTFGSNLSTPRIPSLLFPPRSSTVTTVSAPVDRLLEYRYLLEELQKIIYQDRVDVLDEEEISRRLLFHFGKLPTKFSEVLDDLIAEAAFLHAEKEVERIKNRAVVKQGVKNAILEQQRAAAAALLEQQSTMTLQQLELDKSLVDETVITLTRKAGQSVEQQSSERLVSQTTVDLTDIPQTELERLQQQTEKLQHVENYKKLITITITITVDLGPN